MIHKINAILCGGYMTRGKVEIICELIRKQNIDASNEDIDVLLRTISVVEDYN